MESWRAELVRERAEGRARYVVAALRIVAGLAFVLTSIGKFTDRAGYTALFESFGLPGSSALVLLVGLVELVGGVLLVLGLGTRLAALALAGNMVGAIATAGVAVGGPIHLGLAPTLLVIMLVLLWAGPGAGSLDARLLVVRPGRTLGA
ncbi:DoxX family protein [Actinomycetospora cinnamomea]|uniref:Putative oxidoreductase n=1 Tax=Actinomycetospora cinnamomea TaxID=663609 RepID=A0A2U1FG20_9PSEU|nr:DoxX family protein [Actinomycetospora cinnamomea]PVZ11155.1 putative oxidoreductase [Actinomycetospora cinnamomea]